MPIKGRDLSKPFVQEPAPSVEKRQNHNGVLHAFKSPKRAATIVYDSINPMKIPTDDLIDLVRTPDNNEDVDRVYRNRVRSKATGIRAFCVFCIGGQPKRVKQCGDVSCALWPFRMGSNPFRNSK